MSQGHKPMNAATNNNKSSVYGNGIPWSNEAGKTERLPRSDLCYPVVNNDDPELIHPNQKPVELCEYLIHTCTNLGKPS
ncbi:site-specific DNA-methyltransferase [Paenibacillus pseudetheri]|uniref:site-specific DNA-methyltransferase n=1 Tax=Paenibacillus pseudetheri TaxID=2897682 RepID=UPI001F3F4196|nr:site-specific DNA-methyltransferase [Paenibacillus pseudetheri]